MQRLSATAGDKRQFSTQTKCRSFLFTPKRPSDLNSANHFQEMNRWMDGVTLVLIMKKPFDLFVEGLEEARFI